MLTGTLQPRPYKVVQVLDVLEMDLVVGAVSKLDLLGFQGGGMSSDVQEAAEKAIKAAGIDVGRRAKGVEEAMAHFPAGADQLVNALLHTSRSGAMIADVDPDLVALVPRRTSNDTHDIDDNGFLVPRRTRQITAAFTWNSNTDADWLVGDNAVHKDLADAVASSLGEPSDSVWVVAADHVDTSPLPAGSTLLRFVFQVSMKLGEWHDSSRQTDENEGGARVGRRLEAVLRSFAGDGGTKEAIADSRITLLEPVWEVRGLHGLPPVRGVSVVETLLSMVSVLLRPAVAVLMIGVAACCCYCCFRVFRGGRMSDPSSREMRTRGRRSDPSWSLAGEADGSCSPSSERDVPRLLPEPRLLLPPNFGKFTWSLPGISLSRGPSCQVVSRVLAGENAPLVESYAVAPSQHSAPLPTATFYISGPS